tara:strand:+ start:412 stop:726 length:315 start_codon:yes stop_codon:yes gene_type:complete
MLFFNAISWWSERVKLDTNEMSVLESSGALIVIGYFVMVISVSLLLLFVILFVIFVVFRGAQLQKKEEDAHAEIEAEQELIDAMRKSLIRLKTQRIAQAWRAYS